MANILTGLRIALSVGLLFCPALSPAFFALYITAGITDMLDGAAARKTGTVSAFGAKFDTIADLVFAAVCLYKLLPALDVPVWLYAWIAAVAALKLTNIAVGFLRRKTFVSVHSVPNKVAGALLFVFPLTLPFVEFRFGAAVVCAAATVAAVWEGYLIQADRTA